MTWRWLLFKLFGVVVFIFIATTAVMKEDRNLPVERVVSVPEVPAGFGNSKTCAALVAAGFSCDRFHSVSTEMKEGNQ